MKTSIIRSLSSFIVAVTLAGATACGAPVSSAEADAIASQDEALKFLPLPPHPPLSCLNSAYPSEFNFHCGAQGFRRAGVFDGGTNTVTSNYAAAPASWDDRTSFPNAPAGDPVDSDGALLFGGASLNEPTPSGLFRVDHISPDLSGNAAWQGKRQYRARLFQSGVIGAALFGQIVLEARKPDGSSALFQAVDAANHAVFCTLASATWTACVANILLPAGSTLTAIRVRVFGTPGTVGEGNLAIDEIAPTG